MKKKGLALPLACFLLLASLFLPDPVQAGQANNSIPFALIDNFIYFKGSINNLPDLNLVFDTGSSTNVIHRGLLRKAGLRKNQKTHTFGVGTRKKVPFFTESKVRIGSLVLKDFFMISFPLYQIGKNTGYRVDGIIGIALTESLIVQLDYQKNLLSFFQSEQEIDKTGYSLVEVVDYAHGIPLLEITLVFKNGRKLRGNFMIDTGANIPLILFPDFCKKNDVINQVGTHYPSFMYGLENTKNSVQVGRLREMRIGGLAVAGPPVYIPQKKKGVFAAKNISGIIGNEILKRFDTIFYLRENKIYISPNDMLEKDFKMDYSGLLLRVEGRALKVDKVIPRSPAASSSIKPGDTITAVNGSLVEAQDLFRIGEILSQPGATVSLQIRPRATASYRRVSLRLRDENL